MILENTTNYRILTPSEGMWLYNANDQVISDKVYLGVNADESTWVEITDEEKLALESEWGIVEPSNDVVIEEKVENKVLEE